MVILGATWLILLVVELVWGLGREMQRLATGIWIAFIIDFGIKWFLAPRKLNYVRNNWLTALALALPALRVFRAARAFRALRAARAVRGIRLVRIMGTINRGMRTLGATLERRGFGYVIALTLIVLFIGAAGMYTFEKGTDGRPGLASFGTALWWTAMLMTTMGTEYWPVTPEGRWLCLFLAVYAFAIFGYITATIATFFIGQDTGSGQSGMAGKEELGMLRRDIAELKAELQLALRDQKRQK